LTARQNGVIKQLTVTQKREGEDMRNGPLFGSLIAATLLISACGDSTVYYEQPQNHGYTTHTVNTNGTKGYTGQTLQPRPLPRRVVVSRTQPTYGIEGLAARGRDIQNLDFCGTAAQNRSGSFDVQVALGTDGSLLSRGSVRTSGQC
jgi:hypothetical protein